MSRISKGNSRLFGGRLENKACRSTNLQVEQLGERVLPSAINFYPANLCIPTNPCVHAAAACQYQCNPRLIPTNPCMYSTNPC